MLIIITLQEVISIFKVSFKPGPTRKETASQAASNFSAARCGALITFYIITKEMLEISTESENTTNII